MTAEPTSVDAPLKLQIADEIRIKIERGDLRPGDSVATLQELAEEWRCSITTARDAVDLLKQQGLITGGRGGRAKVREQPRRRMRDSARHQAEKDLVLAPEEIRAKHGEAEDDIGELLERLQFRTDYSIIPANEALAAVFSRPVGEPLLRKEYETSTKRGTRLAYSVAFVPKQLLEGNPALLSSDCEPWPGGGQHQFHTVGIEIARMDDEVTAVAPTTVDMKRWALEPGVCMLHVRRIAIDTQGRVVEISDAQYPADRTALRFSTPLAPLKPWKD